jgi:hypothetical protein
MSFTVTSTQEIERLAVEPQAKNQIKEIFKVCKALDGNLTVTPPSEKIIAGRETDYYFATAICNTPKEHKFDEVRLSGSGRLELIGENWLTIWGTEEPPSFVVRLTGEPTIMKRAYLDNKQGVDSIEGDLKVKGIFAYVQRDGRYINMELELV